MPLPAPEAVHPAQRDSYREKRDRRPAQRLRTAADSKCEQNRCDQGEGYLRHRHGGHHELINPSASASASGTSRVILNSAVEKTLPCASVLSESVPPPSSAPCRRKLSAFRFGSSNRTTGPSIAPAKWAATRSFVTCRSRMG